MKHQGISSLVIIAIIVVTCTFVQVVVLRGEIRCLSLLGFKGLMEPSTGKRLRTIHDWFWISFYCRP